jgi:hypothetical protein
MGNGYVARSVPDYLLYQQFPMEFLSRNRTSRIRLWCVMVLKYDRNADQ